MTKKSQPKSLKSPACDVAVIGGGAMGTNTAWQLARRGVAVRLFEQFGIGHELGSSHGYSRIIRRAYYEHPDYVPLVDRAYELWREIERESGEHLLSITGIVEMGRPGGELLTGSALSCRQHAIPHECLSAREIMRRFPQFKLPPWMAGIWQKDAGILAVERCVLACRTLARQHGAVLHEEEEVLALQPDRAGVTIVTRRGTYRAKQAVVCAGAWAGRLFKDLRLPLKVERQTLGFFKPLKRELFELGRFPLFLMELPGKAFYGFPFFGIDCMKVARHHGGPIVTPETVNRSFTQHDERELYGFLKRYIPAAAGTLQLGKVCLYTNTPDFDFILDRHPVHRRIVIAAGFSGHGFKFASTVGEVMADLATFGQTRHPIGRFSLGRFSRK